MFRHNSANRSPTPPVCLVWLPDEGSRVPRKHNGRLQANRSQICTKGSSGMAGIAYPLGNFRTPFVLFRGTVTRYHRQLPGDCGLNSWGGTQTGPFPARSTGAGRGRRQVGRGPGAGAAGHLVRCSTLSGGRAACRDDHASASRGGWPGTGLLEGMHGYKRSRDHHRIRIIVIGVLTLKLFRQLKHPIKFQECGSVPAFHLLI